MADSSRLHGERVFCHQCSHEWDRAQGGLQCPNCESEFTEVLEAPQSPPPETRSPPPLPPNHPFHNHNPWEDDVPDPDEDDVTTYQWNSRGGNGTFSFTTRTFVSGGGRMNGHNVDDDPAMRQLVQNFEGLLTHIVGPQNGRSNPPIPQIGGGLFPFMGQPPPGFRQPPRAFGGFVTTDQDGIMRPQARSNVPDQQIGNIQDIFGMLFGAFNPPTGERARGADQPPDFATLIASILGGHNGRAGDHVFTQEAFDQVMSQLMEQNPGSTAPPPASAEAINALPKKNVTTDMMGNDGKVECSICMDDVEVGTEVTVLPCNHWFHDDCITHWLKEHDTCPHCRKPISDHEAADSSSSRRNRPSTSRRPSSISSPRAPPPGDGSRNNPFTLPDSPSAVRERRQQYFSRRGEDDVEQEHRRRHRSTSANNTSRPSGDRQASSSSNAGGGPISWVRNHMPFGS